MSKRWMKGGGGGGEALEKINGVLVSEVSQCLGEAEVSF